MAVENLSILAEFDDIIRLEKILLDGSEQEFMRFALSQEECRLQWLASSNECKRLQDALSKAQREITTNENNLQHARRLLDDEKKRSKAFEMELRALERQLGLIRDLLMPQQNKLNDETKEKLAFLNSTARGMKSSLLHHEDDRMKTIAELDTTGSILSDLSFSRSEDDLDTSFLRSGKIWKNKRPSLEDTLSTKRKRSSHSSGSRKGVKSGDQVIATTTVHVSREGPVTATSIIQASANKENMRAPAPPMPKRKPQPSAPPLSESSSEDWNVNSQPNTRLSGGGLGQGIGIDFDAAKKMYSRQHCFTEKTVIKSENCTPCNKKITFGKMALKCCDCKVVCHPECKEQVPLPCVPSGNTPTFKKGVMGSIADYTPISSPMVPSLVIHCINEIESRGLSEVGIYRVPGSEKDVRALKEKFLRGKGAPNLQGYDIHVVCGVLKDFLRSLREPLITHGLWHDFARAAVASDHGDSVAALYQAVSELPQPNRDTLAYLILHLQKVASCPDCKMPILNLSKIFGPTITGYSAADVTPAAMLTETKNQQMIVEALMKISSDYWNSFVRVDSNERLFVPQSKGFYGTPVKTPSAVKDSVEGSRRKRFFRTSNTPTGPYPNRWKGTRFFDTP